MKIEILGTGCAKCNQLAQNARVAVETLGLEDCAIVKVTDFQEIARRGVLMTPALLVDGQVKVIGKASTPDEITGYLRESVAERSN